MTIHHKMLAIETSQPSAAAKPGRQSDGLGRHILYGYGVIGFLFLGTFGWAGNTMISGAIVGSGRVVVKSSEKLVQHPTGGVIGKIFVQDGAHAEAGQLLVQLDETALRANLTLIESGLSADWARLARLQAERDETTDISFPFDKAIRPTKADADSMRTERQLFQSRRRSLENRTAQLQAKISELQQQVKGYDVSLDSVKKQWRMAEEELAAARGLMEKKLAVRSSTAVLAQSAARLEGAYGATLSDRAVASAQIEETQIQMAGLREQNLAEVMRDLRETEARIAEQTPRQISAQDQLQRLAIRAPASGTVHELAVHTVGGVINAGEVLMKIVPDDASLIFEVRINPTDVDQVHLGQMASLRFPAFNRTKTPELSGVVTMIGADASTDRQSGRSFYELNVAPPADIDEQLKAKGIALVPGMPVEIFIETGDRTALSYFLKPLTDQIKHAFREE